MIFLILYAILLFNEQKLFNRDKIQLGRDNRSGPITRVEIFPVAPFTEFTMKVHSVIDIKRIKHIS